MSSWHSIHLTYNKPYNTSRSFRSAFQTLLAVLHSKRKSRVDQTLSDIPLHIGNIDYFPEYKSLLKNVLISENRVCQ